MGNVGSYFQNIRYSVQSSLEGMAVTMSWLFRKPITTQYPYHKSDPKTPVGGPDTLPERYRGFLEVDMSACSACLACERACPIECIKIKVEKIALSNEPDAKPVRMLTRFDIDLGKCMYCGLCSEPCPTGSIRHTQHFEGATQVLDDLIVSFVEADKPVLPYKVVKGQTPDTAPKGSIVQKYLRLN